MVRFGVIGTGRISDWVLKGASQDPQVDAVYIGTPNETHCPLTLACLKASKHVLCEKPLAVNAEEGRQMVQAAKESGCLLMEAMISTLNPIFVEAASRIAEVAPVRQYSSFFCQYSSRYDALKKGVVGTAFTPWDSRCPARCRHIYPLSA